MSKRDDQIAAIARIVIAAIFLFFSWAAGWLADTLTSVTRFSWIWISGFIPVIALWLLVLILSLLPAIAIYTPELNHRIRASSFKVLAVWNPNKFQTLYFVALSYAMTAYLFSVIFKAISNLDRLAFNQPIESLGTAGYFSIVTLGTVGYGDIVPVSAWARFMTAAEILVGVMYGVFFFSVIAGFLRDGQPKKS